MRGFKIWLALLAAVAASTLCTGCQTALGLERAFFTVSPGATASLGGIAVGTAASCFVDGPRLSFHNDTDRPLQVRWWVGRVDVTAPEGMTDLRTARHMLLTVQPGTTERCFPDRRPWPTGQTDAVVWAQVTEPGCCDQASRTWWLDLARPAPYRLRAHVCDGEITFDRADGRAVAALSPDRAPIGQNEGLPVYADGKAAMAE